MILLLTLPLLAIGSWAQVGMLLPLLLLLLLQVPKEATLLSDLLEDMERQHQLQDYQDYQYRCRD